MQKIFLRHEQHTTIETYMVRIQQSFPQIAIRTAVPITRGWDSFVLEVNDELIFRFAMRKDVVTPA